MTTKRLRTALVFASAGALVVLAGCSAGGDDASGGPTEINIIAPSNPPSDAGFQAVTEAFNAANPDIHATYTGVSDYETTRAAQLTASKADIVACYPRQPTGLPDEVVSEDTLMAQSGTFVDLTDEPFMDNYLPSVLASPRSAIDDRVYAVPTGLSYATGVYYNKSLFDELGLEIPTTWDELQDVMSVLNENNVTPFGFGGLDAFPAALPLYGILASYYPTDADKTELLEGIYDGSVDLTEGAPLEVMERLQTVYDNTTPTSPGISVVESFGAFANGEFAMLFDGSWDQKSIADVVGTKFDVGMFPLPGGDDAADNHNLNGKLELQMCAVEGSEHKEAALKWLEFFSQPENYATFTELSGFAPSQPDIASDDAFLNSIADYTSEFSLFWEAIFIAPQGLAPEGGVGFAYQLLPPLGAQTPEEAAAAAEAAWEAVR
ncbi:ABC transporter substrate-binding protein [Microbacterium sp. MC2]